MGQEIVYCFKCASRLLGADFDKAKAFRFEGKSVCLPCAQALLPALAPESRDTLAQAMEEASRQKATGSVPLARPPGRPSESSRKLKPVEDAPAAPSKSPGQAVLLAGGGAALVLIAVAAAVLSSPSRGPAPRTAASPAPPPPPPPSPPPKVEANFSKELSELDGQARAFTAKEEFRSALSLLEAARKRHPDRDWTDFIDGRALQVQQDAQKLLATLKARALEAQRRKAAADVAALRARIARWGLEGCADEFDRALAAAVAPPPPPPPPPPPSAGPPLTVFDDALARGWADWSWGALVDLANARPAFEGERSIAFTPRQGSAGLYLHSNAALSPDEYPYVAFSAQAGRPDASFVVQLYDENNKAMTKQVPLAELGGLPPVGKWKRYVIPLAHLNPTRKKVRGFSILSFKPTDTPALYLDSLAFLRAATEAPAPAPKASSKYSARWAKAVELASVRDYEGAMRELDDEEKNARESADRAEVAADLEALRAARALHDRAAQALVRWPRGFNVPLTRADEAGKLQRLDEPLLRAEATRVDVRQEKGSLTVEIGEILPGALLEILRKGEARPFDPAQAKAEVDARAAALFCLLEGDLEGAERQKAEGVPEKYVERARQIADARAATREVEARRLLARAHAAHRDYATRADSAALYRELLQKHAETALVRRNRASLQSREDAARDYFFGPGDLDGSGAFRPARLAEGRLAWTCEEDAGERPKADTYVDLDFSVPEDLEYRAWVFAGACCAETFSFSVQGTEMAGAEPGGASATPVPVTLPYLSKTHAAHGGRRKEPSRWDWIPLPLPKYAAPGAKKLRLLSDQQGFTVVWAIVSAVRKAPPKESEARELERDRPPLRIPSTPAVVTGKILYERWTGIPGTEPAALTGHASFQGKPSRTLRLGLFEAPANAADEYGARFRGYVHPPATGAYTFWIASDDDSELWLSQSEDPAKKVKIAHLNSVVNAREWAKHPAQKSAPVVLTKGKRYYVEALHKEGKSADHVAVGWQLPDGTQERPIPGSRLSPFVAGPVRPAAIVTSPADGALFTAGATVTVSADYFGGIPSRADLLVGARKLGDARTDPIGFTWQNVPAGSHPLVLRVIDKSGDAVFSPPVAIRVGEISFYRGINLNGPPVTIDGNPWEGRGAAEYSTNGHGFERDEVDLRPPTDFARASMIRTSVYSRAGTTLTLGSVPAGSYLVYVYVWEDNESQTFDLLLNGRTVQPAYSSGQAGRWDRLGPWGVEVKDGKIELRAAGGAANFSGVEVWRVGAAAEARTPTPTALVGGEGGTPFEDVAGERGLLAGVKLWYGTFENRRVVKALQPLYVKDGVRSEGEIHGKTAGTAVEVLAKPGYALGGLAGRGSARVDALRFVFMKVAGGRLQPGDRYETEWYGGPGGGAETALAGDGSPVAGIHGRKGDDVDALGLILLK
jgi:hypothetical protein